MTNEIPCAKFYALFRRKSFWAVLLTILLLFLAAKIGNDLTIWLAAIAVISLSAFYVFYIVAKTEKTEEE